MLIITTQVNGSGKIKTSEVWAQKDACRAKHELELIAESVWNLWYNRKVSSTSPSCL